MNSFSDDQLSAYRDGQLGPDETHAIAAALESDAALRRRLRIMEENDALLRAAFNSELERMRFVMPPARKQLRTPDWWRMAAAVLVSAAVGWSVATFTTRERAVLGADGIATDDTLSQALSQARAGVPYDAGGDTITIALSFRDKAGAFCRQFNRHGLERESAGVACRSHDGWEIAGWFARRQSEPGGYREAGGGNDPKMEALMGSMGVEKVLDSTSEAVAIKKQWRGE